MNPVSRRQFLRAGAVGAGLAAMPFRAAEDGAKLPISIQLYTLRNLMRKDFDGTLKKVAELGYPAVEFAGYGARSGRPKKLRAFLDDLGMVCSGAHEGFGGIQRNATARAEFIQTLGGKHLTVPSLPKEFRNGGKDGYRTFGDKMNALGEACAKAGCTLSYHNHAFEFKQVEGKSLFEWMLGEMDPKLVKLEVDVFWVKKGGVEPADFIEQHNDRIALLHMKGMAKESGRFAPVGTGSMDTAAIVAAGKEAKCDWYVVEQDRCWQPELDAVKISLENLKVLLA